MAGVVHKLYIAYSGYPEKAIITEHTSQKAPKKVRMTRNDITQHFDEKRTNKTKRNCNNESTDSTGGSIVAECRLEKLS